MATFSYKAKSKDGTVIKGKVDSPNKTNAVRELSQMDLIVYEVEPINDLLNKEITIGRPLKQKDFTVFLRQFATLLEAGILLINALELLAEQTESPALKAALENISEEVQEGQSLSEGMGQYPELFPTLLVQMVRSGEVSGNLQDVLDRMATYYEKQQVLREKISTALTYPLVVSVFAILITVFLLLFIVPIFGDMYASMGEELPLITRLVLGLSSFIRNYWWVFFLIAFFLIWGFQKMRKEDAGNRLIDYISLKLPILGDFIQKAVLARMTQTLSSLINSSVPILQAVEVTSEVVGNQIVKDILLESRDALERGESLAKPMEDSWVIPPLIIQMIHVGEESGALDEMLGRVATIYDRQINEASDKLQSLIEPVLIIFLAIIIGIIVLSIVVPMFGLFNTF